jgi:hypothetical protein
MAEDEAKLALDRPVPVWEELFRAEQARIIYFMADPVQAGLAALRCA